MDVLQKARELAKGKLLYLTKFGSELYGTNIPGKSDTDVKGLFLQDPKSILLNDISRSPDFKTGDDLSRNTADDFDIGLWSIQEWFKMLHLGDTGAIDTLFSVSHVACIIYKDPILDDVFNNPLLFINPKDSDKYVSYCINQAKKYGIKGSRLGIIKGINEFLDTLVFDPMDRLSSVADKILDEFSDTTYCVKAHKADCDYLRICGKYHQYNITMHEFAERLRSDYEESGERARQAMLNNGIDWKALSHAYRCIIEMKQLLSTGKITFPIENVQTVMAIKTGLLEWTVVEVMITEGLKDISELIENCPMDFKSVSKKYTDCVILNMYRKLYGIQLE